MKSIFLASVFLLASIVIESGNKTPIESTGAPKDQYCDYCKADFPETHFPCLLKVAKAKINTRNGRVEFAIGQPITGILVRMEKNGIDSLSLTPNEKGEIELNNLPQGNYNFKLTLPFTNPKSEFAGRPIGGAILSIGKKGTKLNFGMISNANGDVLLGHLEASDYKLIITSPTDAERTSPLYRSYFLENFSPNFKGNR
ncbi:carboxypeptidase-like regulatory domain-containing protein [Pedobacter sp. KR3-3]|uniref:Carboxypeptidase-like regulatory domain-containing protein n=1 Tax=Pedobacter albus TaxID=3113905 RepID=A0ABU7I925_9SPHI|nr:carboxypeptidase-like regulatory domain-containing protein [Pedobacter sp. KR3-3]MEE1945980.1 carboxypeptidase-like regulatory domain-containing protein [Pedobacter sp. KR3-3]